MISLEMRAAQLEAHGANADMMREWINNPRTRYDDQWITALRYYRECAEKIVMDMINAQISEITPEPEEAEEDHIDYPHWPGTLYGCGACEALMQAQAEWEYDNRERLAAEAPTQILPTIGEAWSR